MPVLRSRHVATGVLRGLELCDAAIGDPRLHHWDALRACLVAATACAAESAATELVPTDLAAVALGGPLARLVGVALSDWLYVPLAGAGLEWARGARQH